MSGEHSMYPPSGSDGWVLCPLWVKVNQLYPKPETEETREGTAAHWVWSEALFGRPVLEGATAPNGVIVTQDMLDAAEVFLEVVRERCAGLSIHIEERVAIKRIHEKCFGTPDLWAFSTSNGWVLEVLDYKHGHRFVDEFENWQCITYTAGILDVLADAMGMPIGLFDQRVTVNITVVQPRCYYRGQPVRTWSVTASNLRAYINRLASAAEVAAKWTDQAVTNSACRDCPGRHVCPALQKAAYSDAEFATETTPIELSPEAASLELKMLERAYERLGARLEGMQEAVSTHIRQGRRVPFHRAEQSAGRTVWTAPHEAVVALGQLFGKDLSKPALVTPNQAKKLGIDESVIKSYSNTPMGSIKLVQINPADARRVFGK